VFSSAFLPPFPHPWHFCSKRCLSAEKVWLAFGEVTPAGERAWSCSRGQPALLQAARRGGRGWHETRGPPGMRSALLGSQAGGILSLLTLADRSRLCGVMAMFFSLISSLGVILWCLCHDSGGFSCDLDSAQHKGHFHFHAPAGQVGWGWPLRAPSRFPR